MNCPNCQAEIPEEANFCPRCRFSLKGKVADGVYAPSHINMSPEINVSPHISSSESVHFHPSVVYSPSVVIGGGSQGKGAGADGAVPIGQRCSHARLAAQANKKAELLPILESFGSQVIDSDIKHELQKQIEEVKERIRRGMDLDKGLSAELEALLKRIEYGST